MAKSKAGDESEAKGHLIGVFGPFASRALVEVPSSLAQELVDEAEIDPAPAFMLDAVQRDLDDLARRDPKLAGSALAESARAMAYEMANPYNSATSKSMCAKVLGEALRQLRELAPPEETADRLDEVTRKRDQRRRRSTGT